MIIYFCLAENPEYKGKPCFLFGQSLGGAVALKVHFKQPDRWDGAVLVAPMCKVWLLYLSLFSFHTFFEWEETIMSLFWLFYELSFFWLDYFLNIKHSKSIRGNIIFTAAANHFNLATFVSQTHEGVALNLQGSLALFLPS
jgi:pimeloyl-ACP methyl ester carboxylesterase